jgi:peptidyl-prolyl cis-trans isomerase C
VNGKFVLHREPLVWFLLAGALIFLASEWWSGSTGRPLLIEISQGQVQSLKDKWQVQMGRSPTERELNSLIEDRVREEVLYREAIELGLDREDTIIRRRLAQKMSFLLEDTLKLTEISESTLKEYFAEQQQEYRVPALYTFTHLYFSSTGEDSASRAEEARRQLIEGAEASSLGDPFMLSRSYAQRSIDEIARLFGSKFAQALGTLSPGDQWHGPIGSSYGFHLVHLETRRDPFMPVLEDVIDRVQTDYLADQRRKLNEARYRDLRSRYQVELSGVAD